MSLEKYDKENLKQFELTEEQEVIVLEFIKRLKSGEITADDLKK